MDVVAKYGDVVANYEVVAAKYGDVVNNFMVNEPD